MSNFARNCKVGLISRVWTSKWPWKYNMLNRIKFRFLLIFILFIWIFILFIWIFGVANGSVQSIKTKLSSCHFHEYLITQLPTLPFLFQSTGSRGFPKFLIQWVSSHDLTIRNASVAVDVNITHLTDDEVMDSIPFNRLQDYYDFAIVVLSYTAIGDLQTFNKASACAWNFNTESSTTATKAITSNGHAVVSTPNLYGEFHKINDRHNSTELMRITTQFYPSNPGVQTVVILHCWKQKREIFGYPVSHTEYSKYPMVDPLLNIQAKVTFQNPYGYLPAVLFAMVPFKCILAIIYLVASLTYLKHLFQYWNEHLTIHLIIFLTLTLSTCETLTAIYAYTKVNFEALPLCCPWPFPILLTLFMKALTELSLRLAATLICLGYGYIRATLRPYEWKALMLLALVYAIAMAFMETSYLMNIKDNASQPPVYWEVLFVASNICFACWNIVALLHIRQKFWGQRGSCLYMMYEYLQKAFITYICVSVAMTAIEGAIIAGDVAFDYEWIWILWASHRIFVSTVLISVAFRWRPQAIYQLNPRKQV